MGERLHRGRVAAGGEHPRIPALIDTGNNFEFSLQHRHLRDWAGIDPAALRSLGTIGIDGQPVDRHEAMVWLYRNVPGTCAVAVGMPPFRLRMERGIAVYARDAEPPGPRLPLLGLPSLTNNDLDWWLDPERRNITVQTRTWRRRLMRLLCRL
ncbi:MAG TPA: hypothetical protein VFB30_06810 [Spirochaetia bacterium]|nr:hypothetical protein [Spirochaetia bacterium]